MKPQAAAPDPPSAIPSERAILGAALLEHDPSEQRRLLALLAPRDLYPDAHRHVLAAMLRVIAAGAIADAPATVAALNGAPVSAASVAELLDYGLSTANAEHHARLIREAGRARRIRAAALEAAYATGPDLDAALARLKEAEAEQLTTATWRIESGSEFMMVRQDPLPSLVGSGLFPAGKVAHLGGKEGTGKSLVCIMLAWAVENGLPWFGIPTIPGGTRTAYAPFEVDDVELQFRYDLCAKEFGGTPPGVLRYGDAVDLLDPSQESHLLHVCAGLGLLIMDPLDEMHSGSMSKEEDANAAMSRLKRVARKTGCSILFAHHQRKGMAGQPDDDLDSSAGNRRLTTSPRLYWKLSKLAKSDSIMKLRVAKKNQGLSHDEIWLERVEGGLPRVVQSPSAKADADHAKLESALLEAGESGLRRVELEGLVTVSGRTVRRYLDDIGAVKFGHGPNCRYGHRDNVRNPCPDDPQVNVSYDDV